MSGEINGEGLMIYSNGNSYRGTFVMGERNGFGVFSSRGLEYYEGEWVMNQKEGKLIIIIRNDR